MWAMNSPTGWYAWWKCGANNICDYFIHLIPGLIPDIIPHQLTQPSDFAVIFVPCLLVVERLGCWIAPFVGQDACLHKDILKPRTSYSWGIIQSLEFDRRGSKPRPPSQHLDLLNGQLT